jgi:secreted PhoX family phosphatase
VDLARRALFLDDGQRPRVGARADDPANPGRLRRPGRERKRRLHEPDNVTIHERSGDGFVAEDADDIQLVQLVQSGNDWTAVPFLQFAGHDGSEVTGPVFSPDGSRLYVNSQRGTDGAGMTFEITGPFDRS